MQEVAVEAYEWVDTMNLGEVAANFARAQLLVTLFDGDPDKWIDFIEREGTPHEREHDLPFAKAIKYRMAKEPDVIPRLRQLVKEFSSLVRLAS